MSMKKIVEESMGIMLMGEDSLFGRVHAATQPSNISCASHP